MISIFGDANERRIPISPGYADSGCLAFTSSGTPCGTSTFPACPDCKSRRSPAGPENKANPCCPCSIVSPRASGLAHLPWDFFRSYRDSERGTWATRSRSLCALRAPTFSRYSRRRRAFAPTPNSSSGPWLWPKASFEESLSSVQLGAGVGPRTRAHVLLRTAISIAFLVSSARSRFGPFSRFPADHSSEIRRSNFGQSRDISRSLSINYSHPRGPARSAES